MKKILAMIIAGILLATTLIMAIGATGASSEAIFDQADIAAAKDDLSSVINVFDGTDVAYDTDNDMLTFGRTGGWSTIRFDLAGTSIDTTQDNWLSGKTVEFELVLVTNGSNRPTLDFSPYPETKDADYTAYNNNANYGPMFWWYVSARTMALVNENDVSGSLNHTKPERVAPITNANDSLKFKMIQTTDKIVVCYYDEDLSKWVAIDDGINVSDLTFTCGGLYFNARGADTWGIKGFSITDGASLTDVKFGSLDDGSENTTATEPTQESNEKYVISQESFRKATNVASFFPAVGTTTGSITAWQGGMNNTVVSYDATNDMVLFDTKGNTNIQGNKLVIPGFDTSNEDAFKGYTIEYEQVLVDINSTNPMSQIGVYFDDFDQMNKGMAIWWYQKTGNLTLSNSENFAHIYDIIGFKKEEGESVKFKLIFDDFGVNAFYDYGDGWQLMGIYESEDMLFNKGPMWFAFRNGDVYGIKNFAMYENEESATTTTESTTTAAPTTAATTTTADTTAAPVETTTTAAEEKKGCGGMLAPVASVIALATVLPCAVVTRKRKNR